MLASDDPVLTTAVRRQLGSIRFRVWLGVSGALTALLVNLPLFGVLGYELGLVGAVLGSLAGLDLGAALVRAVQARPVVGLTRAVPPWRLVTGLAARATVAPSIVVAVPAVAAAIHGAWAPTCDWWYGVESYLVLAVASALLGAGSGVAVALVAGRTRFVGGAAPWLTALALAAAGLHRFYTEPPVFTFNPLVGYFPGNLYDENIRLTAALYWARAEQLLVVIALLAGAAAILDAPSVRVRLRERRPRPLGRAPLACAVIAAAAAGALRWSAGDLGYAIDASDIQAELGGVHRTRHFVIYYADREDIAADIELIAADHELRLAQVCATLGLDPDRIGTIRSYYFADVEQKGRLFGARRVEMAKPWRHEIYLSHREFPHPSLRHEIAHVVAASFGSPGFGVSARHGFLFNPGLIEGLAVAVDWPGSHPSLTPHQQMRAMELLGFAPDVRAVLSVRFLALASSRGYTAAGSFMRFLLDRHGPAALRRLYRSGGDFEGVYGVDLGQLTTRWRAMLDGVTVPAGDLAAARERFRTPGVFARPCPHAIAARLERAARLVAGGRRGAAVALLRRICRDAPQEPRYRLALADALDGGEAGERAEAHDIYVELAGGAAGAVVAAEAMVRLARRAAADGDWLATRAWVTAGLALAVDDDRARQFEAMAHALDEPGLVGVFERGYFFAGEGDRAGWAACAALVAPGHGLPWYLLGLQAAGDDDWATATSALDLSLRLDLPSPRFARNAARRLPVLAWRSHAPGAFDRALAVLATTGYRVDQLLADDWRARRAFAVTSR